ncbi:MAG: hypothetical protein GX494_12065 [Clostridiaceae bacterium]|nr:hypothetical protein [Clostridiaceae bacterium]
MSLPLKQSRAVRELATVLYDFLPWSGSSAWKGHITFKIIADGVGVGDYWQRGSKLPGLVTLLERTLESRRDRFEYLVVEIVRNGLTYREKQGRPITPEELDKINGLILEIGFKFPDLWDPDLRTSLSANGATRAKSHLEQALHRQHLVVTERTQRRQELEILRQEFIDLHESSDRQKAGYQLEKMLNRLFALHGLDPRQPFRSVGEQIDGSFELDHEIYLVEVKWQQSPCSAGDLYAFREKILGKSQFTRGVFVSIYGISLEAQESITKGKQPTFFIVDGHDLMVLLGGDIDLTTFLRRRQRLLAEEGRVLVPTSEAFAQ